MASRRVRRSCVALLAAGLALVGLAGPASAHDRLVSSDPADGATVVAVPAALTLEFSDEVLATGTQVAVTSGGTDVGTAAAQVDGATVTVALPPDLANGEYDVAWRAVSADGHPIEGTLAFVLAVPSPSAGATPSPDGAALASTDDDPSATTASDLPTDTASAADDGEVAAPVSPSPESGETPAPNRSPIVGLLAGLAIVATVAALVLRRRHGMRGFGPPGQD